MKKEGQLWFFYSCLHHEGWPTVAVGDKDERKEAAASLFYSQCRPALRELESGMENLLSWGRLLR